MWSTGNQTWLENPAFSSMIFPLKPPFAGDVQLLCLTTGLYIDVFVVLA
jgi:hypothetical protein